MVYRNGVYVGEGLPGDPEPTNHDFRIDPYVFYPQDPKEASRVVRVVCIHYRCPEEFIGVQFISPWNKSSWPKWETP